jgi:hypothetical protein
LLVSLDIRNFPEAIAQLYAEPLLGSRRKGVSSGLPADCQAIDAKGLNRDRRRVS